MRIIKNIERAKFCYEKDKERLKRHIKRLIIDIQDYQNNKDNYKKYIFNEELNDYVENDKLYYLDSDLEELNSLLSVCEYEKLENVYKLKDNDYFINYLKYLLERD